MSSEVEYRANFNYWSQNEKWKGFFFLVWLIIKDVPNRIFRNLINEYNENKPVTSSRDTQEIHPLVGAQMLKIFNEYPYESSILDDFNFYEKRQEYISKQPGKNEGPNLNPEMHMKDMIVNNPQIYSNEHTKHFSLEHKKVLKRVNSSDHLFKDASKGENFNG